MSVNRRSILFSILKGLLTAVGLTLVGMLVIAALAVFVRIPDHILTLINQLLKMASILLSVWVSVGRGGSRGFVTGAVIALLYMISGYGFYVLLGGGVFSFAGMLGEILLGAAVGSVFGAILANMKPASKRRRRRP